MNKEYSLEHLFKLALKNNWKRTALDVFMAVPIVLSALFIFMLLVFTIYIQPFMVVFIVLAVWVAFAGAYWGERMQSHD